MVAPIYIIATLLGVAFALGLFGKKMNSMAGLLSVVALGFASFISLEWLAGFWLYDRAAEYIYTAGFKPPFSINLLMGKDEALFTSLINIAGFFGTVYLWDKLKKIGSNGYVTLMGMILGLNVIIMTRDLFNLFVFLEISSIATAGLIIFSQNLKTIAAGFKYMLATGIISGILLLGIIFMYYFTGTLNIDDFLAVHSLAVKGFGVAVFFVLISIVLELKPFPANGWGLDVYESADSGIAAMISAGTATASFFVMYKLLPLGTPQFHMVLAGIGLATFIGSNLMGLKQTNPNRLLGYSSIGQVGLLVTILGLSEFLGERTTFIAYSILISHFLAKAGLFWISGIVKRSEIKEWAVLRNNRLLLILFGVFIFTLIGFPPFPSFFGKWDLVLNLASNNQYFWIVGILIGSLLEGVYLFRWLGYALKLDNAEMPAIEVKWNKVLPIAVFGAATFVVGYFVSSIHPYAKIINYIPLAVALAFVLIDFLPVYVKNTLAILAMAYYYYYLYPTLSSFGAVFGAIFMVGGIVTLIAGYAFKGQRRGFYPFALMMFAGLIGLIEAKTTLGFFYAWEVMTVGSYFLIIRGKKSMPHALSYMLFSMGGAYLMLAGFAIASVGQFNLDMSTLSHVLVHPTWVFILLAVGFLTKTASLGLHIWLPGAHAEAETDVSPMVSAILLKAGVFGLVTLFLAMGDQLIGGDVSVIYLLGWLGAITAVMGNLMAAFQEDAKRLLAYSSVGVLGYILFGLSLMSHLGWLSAVSISVTHFMFKSLLFLAIGGVVWRVKTKEMYRMGGLIKRMPFSFFSVLIGIIVLAGLPPLSGFSGKWIFYNAVMAKEWYLQGALIFFSGMIAFLYTFRLIHSVFLGQLKDEHREVKEAPFWILVPQYMIIGVLLYFSAIPNSLLKPIGKIISPYFPTGGLEWTGQHAVSTYGYWNGLVIFYIVIAIFVTVLVWLIINNRKAQKVKQFNIVFAAERPFKPETSHYAYNFYAHYRKAIGILVEPKITGWWEGVAEWAHAMGDKFRKIYNGNGQSYLIHIMAFIVIIYLISFGGF